MNRRRILTACLVLAVLGILAIGLYIYQNLPSLVQREALRQLREYGVAALELPALQVTDKHITAEGLFIRASIEGLEIEAQIEAAELGYHWRKLLQGKLDYVVLERVDIVLRQREQPTADSTLDLKQMLPGDLLSGLPLEQLEIKHWQLTYHSPQLDTMTAAGQLRLADTLLIDATSRYQGSELAASARFDHDASQLQLQASVRLADQPMLEFQAHADHSRSDTWLWQVQGEVQFAPLLDWLRQPGQRERLALENSALDSLAVAGRSVIQGTVSHPNRMSLAAADIPELLGQIPADLRLQNFIEKLDYPGVVDEFATELDLSLAIAEGGQWHVSVAPGKLEGLLHTGLLPIDESRRRSLGWGSTTALRLEIIEPILIAGDIERIASLRTGAATGTLGDPASELHLRLFALDTLWATEVINPAELSLAAAIDFRLQSKPLPQLKLQLQHQGSGEQSDFALSLADSVESILMELEGVTNLATGAGEYRLALNTPDLPYLASTTLPLLAEHDLFDLEMTINAGSATLESTIESLTFDPADWRQQSRLSLSGVSGTFDGYEFQGLGIQAHWRGIEQWQTLQPVTISLDKVSTGFDILNLKSSISLPDPTPISAPGIRIEQLSADLFGGQIYLAEPRPWQFGADGNQLTLRARDWSLADLVALQQNRDIEASGILEGELPVTVSAGRFMVSGGFLRALPPGGNIRYTVNEGSRAVAASSPELKIALDLLDDFNYEVLSSKVELDQQGILLLGLSLSGSNEQVYEGRRIEFNINLEQNLDPLLQSLRLSDNLVKGIESGLK